MSDKTEWRDAVARLEAYMDRRAGLPAADPTQADDTLARCYTGERDVLVRVLGSALRQLATDGLLGDAEFVVVSEILSATQEALTAGENPGVCHPFGLANPAHRPRGNLDLDLAIEVEELRAGEGLTAEAACARVAHRHHKEVPTVLKYYKRKRWLAQFILHGVDDGGGRK